MISCLYIPIQLFKWFKHLEFLKGVLIQSCTLLNDQNNKLLITSLK